MNISPKTPSPLPQTAQELNSPDWNEVHFCCSPTAIFRELLDRAQTAEPIFAKTFVSELAVETFNIKILCGTPMSED